MSISPIAKQVASLETSFEISSSFKAALQMALSESKVHLSVMGRLAPAAAAVFTAVIAVLPRNENRSRKELGYVHFGVTISQI